MNLTFLGLFFFFFTAFFLIIFIIFTQLAVLVCCGRLLRQPRSAEHSVLVWASLKSFDDTNMTLNMTATKQSRNHSAVA